MAEIRQDTAATTKGDFGSDPVSEMASTTKEAKRQPVSGEAMSIQVVELHPKPSDEKEAPNWKPWTVRWCFLTALILAHCVQIAGLSVILSRYKAFQSHPIPTQPEDQDEWLKRWHMFAFDMTKSRSYLAWQFLHVLFAVAVGMLWSIVDSSVRQMEPYFQLSRPGGCLAADALITDYATRWLYGIPLKAGKRAQWAVALSALINILAASVLPILCSSMWQVSIWSLGEQKDGAEVQRICLVQITTGLVYVAIGVSTLSIVVASCLMAMLMRRDSGMISRPGGLAGLASLICDSPSILWLFQELHPCANQAMIAAKLSGKRFHLRYVDVPRHNAPPELAYQVVVSTADEDDDDDEKPEAKDIPLPDRLSRSDAHPSALGGRLYLAAEFLSSIPVGSVLLCGNLNRKLSIPLVKALLTFAVALATTYHDMVQQALHTIQPYLMLKGPRRSIMRTYQAAKKIRLAASHTSLSLDFGHLSLPATFFRSLRHSHWVLAFGAFNLICIQVQMIFIPSLFEAFWELWLNGNLPPGANPFNVFSKEENYRGVPPVLRDSFMISLTISSFTSIFLFFHILVVLFNRRQVFMPRRPDSMASNMAYLASSAELLEAVRGTSLSTSQERGVKLKAKGKEGFEFGWFQGMGKMRVGVEVAPIQEPYIFDQKRPGGATTV